MDVRDTIIDAVRSALADLGVDPLVVGTGDPFDLGPLERLIAQRDALG